ncbi:MAG: (Fe-S)-binding protein [Candidatus Helarchaeota archaeon]
MTAKKTNLLKLEDFKQEVWSCGCCSMCRNTESEGIADRHSWIGVCPVYDVLRFDHYTSKGRNSIAKYLLDEILEYNQSLAEDVIFRCLGCKACEEICTPTLLPGMQPIENMKIVRAMREDCWNLGLVPDRIKNTCNKIMDEKFRNPYGLDKDNRWDWAEYLNIPDNGEILYFAGCAASYQNQTTPEAVVKIFQAAGIKIAYLGNKELCCGHQLIWNGSINEARKNAQDLIDLIKETGAKKVVFSCAGCYSTFKNDYKSIGIKVPFKVEHIVHTFSKLLKKLEITKKITESMTYHDPCHLGRHSDEYKNPRKIIGKVGATLVEMERNKRFSWCCGAGSGGNCLINYPELNNEIRSRRILEAKETGAKILITACPMCVKNLRDAAYDNNINMKFYDIPNLVAEALGLKSDLYDSWEI